MKNEASGGRKNKNPVPILDRAAAQETSLNVLKRFDPEVEEVLAMATHVSLYSMTVTTRQWARKNVEGSLFLVKRRGRRFQLLVLNKLSTDIFSDPVDGNFEFELNKPYLMYTKGNEEIIGIWFYEEDDLVPFSNLLNKVITTLPKPEPAAAPAAAPTTEQTLDWISRLEQAKPNAQVAAPAQPAPEPTPPAAARAPKDEEQAVPFGNLTTLLMRAQQKHQQSQVPPPSAAPAVASTDGSLPQPTALLHHPHPPTQPNGTSADGPPQPPLQLLAPNFFQPTPAASPAAQEPSLPTSNHQPQPSVTVPVEKPNILLNLLQRGSSKVDAASAKATTASAVPAAAPAAAAAAVLEAAPPPRPLVETREKLRGVLHRLLQNDAVVDALAQELKHAGLLQ